MKRIISKVNTIIIKLLRVMDHFELQPFNNVSIDEQVKSTITILNTIIIEQPVHVWKISTDVIMVRIPMHFYMYPE